MRSGATAAACFAVTLMALLLVFGYGAGIAAAQNKVLKVGSGVADAGSIDLHFATTFGEYPIVKAMFNGLVDLPAGTTDMENIEPDLATDWSVSEDGTVWTFHLRQGVQWHHGYGEFTSSDVVYSFNRMKREEVGSPWRSEVANIKDVRRSEERRVGKECRSGDAEEQ